MNLGKGSQLQPVVEQVPFPSQSIFSHIHSLQLLTHESSPTLPSVKAVNLFFANLSPCTTVPEPRNTESPPSCAALEACTLFDRSHYKNEGIFEYYDCRTAYSIE